MPPKNLVENNEYYRAEYLKMIVFPFDLITDKLPNVITDYVGDDDMCKIHRLSIEVTDGFFFYGILMSPHGVTKAPLVIAQHGGGGTPESCSDTTIILQKEHWSGDFLYSRRLSCFGNLM